MAEYWDVYDKNRKRTGKLHKRGIRMQPGEYNIVCEAWIVSGNRLLVTQRCKYKNFGGLWECTGGAVKDVADEELTFKGTKHGAAFFIDCYELHRDLSLDDLTLQTEEVSGAKFVTLAEFEKMQKEKKLIPGLFDFMTELEFSFVTGKTTCPKGNKK